MNNLVTSKLSQRLRIGLLFSSFFIVSCSSSYEILMIIPDGYTGKVVINYESPKGQRVAKVDNRITLTADKEGQIFINGGNPTQEWHRMKAQYVSGTSIPVCNECKEVDDKQVALRSVGHKVMNGENEEWYVIGTYADIDLMRTVKDGFNYKGN